DEANELLEKVINSLSMENPLYKALEETGVFPVYCIKTVMAGELSGRLFEALSAMSEYYEKDEKLREDVKSAVVSPIIMLVIASAIIAVLIIKVLPMFGQIFADFNPEVYQSISRSIRISAAAGTVMLVLCLIAVLFFTVLYAVWNRGGNSTAGKAAADFPITKSTFEAVSMARFAGAVSMMIDSGLTAAEALENVKGISGNYNIEKKIELCSELVMNDVPLSDAIEKSELLPVFYAQTLRVSYRSGAFDTAWKKISDKLNNEADTRIKKLIGASEPVLAAILTADAAVIMLTVMIPLMNIMSAI
ncbi:MAG: type II secretion system F family protein, partial [Huintestinicola sp.]